MHVRFDPWTWVASLPGVRVRSVRLPDDEMGGWVPEAATILLDDRLSPAEERCTVTHEAVHAVRGDVPLAGVGPDGDRLHRRQERTADVISAWLLLHVDELAHVLARTHDLEEAAAELDVDEDTLWTRLESLGDADKAVLQQRVESIEGRSWPLD